SQWHESLRHTLDGGIRMLCLKSDHLADSEYAELAESVIEQARASSTKVLLDRTPEMVMALGGDGLHWPADRLAGHEERPLSRRYLFAVSASERADLRRASLLGADFMTVASVLTRDRDAGDKPALGWPSFET